MFRKAAVLALTLFPFLAYTAPFPDFEQIRKDFRPLSGYVVMEIGDEFLIDLDAAEGLIPGDLVAVVKPGEKIVHPVTHEVLGTLDEVKGILQVTRIKDGYSHAKPVGKASTIERGDVVRRFENVPAAFRNETRAGEAFFEELKSALPHLNWRQYAAGETSPSPIVFVLGSEGLKVLGPAGEVLRNYPLAKGATPSSPPVPPSPALVPAPTTPQPSGAIVRKDSSRQSEGIIFGPDMKGQAAGVATGDFDGDGSVEIAALFPYRLEVFRLQGGEWTRTADLDFGVAQKALAIDSADLDGDGRPEMYVTAANDGDLWSLVVAFREGGYQVVQKGIRLYFRSMSLPGEGQILLGQKMGTSAEDFSGAPFRLHWVNGEVKEGSPVELPMRMDIYGSTPLSGPDGSTLYARIGAYDKLKILRGSGEVLWESEEPVGGSEEYLERTDPNTRPHAGDNTRNAYLQKRLGIDREGRILIPVNEGSRVFSRARTFSKSHLKAMKWNGHTLEEVWRTQPQQAYLADFSLTDVDNDGKEELVQALVFTREGFLQKGRSALAVYELD